MKKFYAIVLGLALVLALSGIANAAAIDVSGSLKIEATYTTDFSWGVSGSTSFGDLNFSKAFGDKATAAMVVGVGVKVLTFDDVDLDEYQDDGEETLDSALTLTVNSGDYTYKFSDAFSLAFMYNKDGFKFVAPALFDAFGLTADNNKSMIKGALTFEGGSAALYTNLDLADLDFGATAAFAAGPVAIGAGLAYNAEGTSVDVNAKYTINEMIAVTADVYYAGEADFGLKASFVSGPITANATFKYTPDMSIKVDGSFVANDMITLSGDFTYDITNTAVGAFQLKAAFKLSETVSAYALYAANQSYSWDKDHDGNSDEAGIDGSTAYDRFELGASFIIDGTNTLSVSYVFITDPGTADVTFDKENKFTATLSIAF